MGYKVDNFVSLLCLHLALISTTNYKDNHFSIFVSLQQIIISVKIKMATTSFQASNLFNVEGLVAVITGGGSGLLPFSFVRLDRRIY